MLDSLKPRCQSTEKPAIPIRRRVHECHLDIVPRVSQAQSVENMASYVSTAEIRIRVCLQAYRKWPKQVRLLAAGS
jgi:hypothetical protein